MDGVHDRKQSLMRAEIRDNWSHFFAHAKRQGWDNRSDDKDDKGGDTSWGRAMTSALDRYGGDGDWPFGGNDDDDEGSNTNHDVRI